MTFTQARRLKRGHKIVIAETQEEGIVIETKWKPSHDNAVYVTAKFESGDRSIHYKELV